MFLAVFDLNIFILSNYEHHHSLIDMGLSVFYKLKKISSSDKLERSFYLEQRAMLFVKVACFSVVLIVFKLQAIDNLEVVPYFKILLCTFSPLLSYCLILILASIWQC